MNHSRTSPANGFYAAGAACALCAILYLAVDMAAVRVAKYLLTEWVSGAGTGASNAMYERRVWASTLVTGLLALLVPILAAVGAAKLKPAQLAMGRPRKRNYAALLCLYLGGCEVLNILAGAVGKKTGSIQSFTLPDDALACVLAFLSICAVPALLEEVLFRGAARALLRPYGAWLAIWGQAVLFALLHEKASAVVFALPVGLFLGWLAETTASIWPGAVLHFINNALAFGMLGLSAAGMDGVASMLSLAEMIVFPLAALACVVWGIGTGKHAAPLPKGNSPWRILKCVPWVLTVAALLLFDIIGL